MEPGNSYLYGDITAEIIKAYYNVYNSLGWGFLEKIYHNAMLIELDKMMINFTSNQAIDVYYEEYKIGKYFADIVVENKVVVEIKTAEKLCSEHEAQLLNYLRATTMEVGILLNFGKKPDFKRKVYSRSFKS
jgi:GxxExxY protein